MKLMITQTIRISEDMESAIKEVANKIGESKQTVIRMAIKMGLKHLDEFLSEPLEDKSKGDRKE